MPTDVEAKALMLDRPADPADVNRVLLDHRHAITLLRQQIGGGQPRGAGTDDGDVGAGRAAFRTRDRSEEHTSELQSLMLISYAVFCLKKKKDKKKKLSTLI